MGSSTGYATEETAVAAMARTYANAGMKIFPLWWVARVGGSCVGPRPACACPLGVDCDSPGKHPIGALPRPDGGRDWIAPHGVKDASADPRVVARWWRLAPHANIGLPADANGLAVIDVDPRHGGDRSLMRLQIALIDHIGPQAWPATVVQTTGSGGEHHLFAAPAAGPGGQPGVPSTKQAFGPLLTGLDTRGRGGYVVAAPSIHGSGGGYEWAAPGFGRRHFFDDPPPWPVALTRLIEAARGLDTIGRVREALDLFARPEPVRPVADPATVAAVARRLPHLDLYVARALAAELDTLRATTAGGRNDQLNRAGYALGRFVAAGMLDEQAAYTELVAAGAAVGLDGPEIHKTVVSGLASGKTRPARLPQRPVDVANGAPGA